MFRDYSGIFRTLIYSKSEPEAYSEPCRTSSMERVAKIVNSCSCFCKLFSQYQLFTFYTYFNKNLFFLFQNYLFHIKKYSDPVGREFWYTHARLSFSFCNNFIKFIKRRYEKQDPSKIMPRSHFLFIVIVIAIKLIYTELFKNTKMSKILLKICFVTPLMFR